MISGGCMYGSDRTVTPTPTDYHFYNTSDNNLTVPPHRSYESPAPSSLVFVVPKQRPNHQSHKRKTVHHIPFPSDPPLSQQKLLHRTE